MSEAPFVSYSINYEDVVLRRIFGGKTDGFFVDVGAEHPSTDNDFYGLYLLGWSGINIEPSRAFFALLEQHRPRDRNVQALLSDAAGQEVAFYEIEGSGLSTCDAEQAAACVTRGYAVTQRCLVTSTLADVLREAGPPHIDVLKVDVEGFEERVLRGNDWTAFRPSVVMVEATYPETPQRRPTSVRADLEAAGYRHLHFDGLNDIYAEAAFAVPDDATLPPNVFDRFIRHSAQAALEEKAQLQASFEAVEGYAHDLEAERKSVEAGIAELHEAAAEAQSKARNADAERQSLAGAVAGLQAEAAQREHAVAQHDERAAAAVRLGRSAMRLATTAVMGRNDLVDSILTAGPAAGHAAGQPKGRSPMPDTRHELVTLPTQSVVDPAAAPEGVLPPEARAELLSVRLQALAAENSRLSNDVEDLRQENRRLLASTGQLQGENVQLRRTLGPAYAVTDEITQLRSRLEDRLHTLDAVIGSRLHEVREQILAQRRATEAAFLAQREEAEAASLAQRQDAEAAVLAQLRTTDAALASGRDGVQRDQAHLVALQAIYASTSWRLTEPLRGLGRLVRRMSGKR